MYSVASCCAEEARAEDNRAAVGRHHTAAWHFLLAAAASPFTSAHLGQLRVLAKTEVDWHMLLSLAEAHGLLPFVYEHLSEVATAIPDKIMRAAAQAIEQNTRQTLWLTQLLVRVSDIFHEHDIRASSYKGPVLAQLLYGNVALRQYSDIDILVRPGDVDRAKRALQGAGFTSTLELSPREEQAYLAAGYEYTFHDIENPNVLELQWRIMPHFQAVNFDTAELLARSRDLRIGDSSIATFGNEDLMLVLCAHAAKHAWCKLSWIRDIAELSQLPDLDWNQMLDQAERLGIRRIVAVSFLVAKKMLSTPVAPAVHRFLTDTASLEIAEEVCRNLETGAELDLDALAYFQFVAELRERRMDRLRFWWRLAATPGVGEWSLVRLPAILSPVYRGMRVARLSARLIRGQLLPTSR